MEFELSRFYCMNLNWRRRGIPGETNCRSVPLDASYHKEQKYILFRGGDLNGVWDIRPHSLYEHVNAQRGPFETFLDNFISISIIFPNSPSSGYWELVRTKFGWISACLWATLWICNFEFWNPLETLYPYLSCPQISELSILWLLRTHSDKIWAERKGRSRRRRRRIVKRRNRAKSMSAHFV